MMLLFACAARWNALDARGGCCGGSACTVTFSSDDLLCCASDCVLVVLLIFRTVTGISEHCSNSLLAGWPCVMAESAD